MRGTFGAQGFLDEDIERRASDATLLERFRESGFIDHATSRCVEQHGLLAHPPETQRVDEVFCIFRQRHMQRDHVCLAQQRFEAVLTRQVPCGIGIPDKGVVGHHVHAEGTGALRHLACDGAETDKTHDLAGEFVSHQAASWPFACDHRLGRGIGAAQQDQRIGDHPFGDGDVVTPRRRDDRQATRLAGRDIDVVQSDPKPADDLQPASGGEDVCPHLRPVADDQRASHRHFRQQAGVVIDQSGIVERVVAGGEARDSALIHEFGDNDIGHVSPQKRVCLTEGCFGTKKEITASGKCRRAQWSG